MTELGAANGEIRRSLASDELHRLQDSASHVPRGFHEIPPQIQARRVGPASPLRAAFGESPNHVVVDGVAFGLTRPHESLIATTQNCPIVLTRCSRTTRTWAPG